MVCSACGYENQVGHRFCGMCGIPLPHRPLTAPGANSTLNLTRVPLETGSGTQHSASGRTGLLTETPKSEDSRAAVNSDGNTPAQTAGDAPDSAGPALEVGPAAISSEPPPKELVPDLPLEEYVKTFHYEPPSDPTEITMRCDVPVQAAEVAQVESPAAEGSPLSADSMPAASSATDGAPPPNVADESPATSTATAEPKTVSKIITVPAAADIDSRLGLEPETPTEARIERPRFLDINQPALETRPGTSGTSTIVGPSFLGLSDASEEAAEPSIIAVEDAEPARGRWRLWLAAAVVLLFAGLGAMEWRAQRNQTGNGPVEIIKTKIRDLRQQNSSPAGSEPAAQPSGSENNAKPEMQVQDQSKPPAQDQAAAAGSPATSSASSTNATAAAPNGAAPASTTPATTPAKNQAPAGQKPDVAPKQTTASGDTPSATGENQTAAKVAKSNSSQEVPQPAAEKPKPTSAATDKADVTAQQTTPGAEEVAKAKNASDSAAQAAWLWKATAKGNPDAPVQLADMYAKGDGVPRSCEQAVVLLKTAAEKENARARSRLATMYATGNCVSRNRVEAYRWVNSALVANPDDQWAQQNRDLLWQQMTPEERAAAGKYRYSK
ncbi:MAG: hypothetical protein WCC87_12505 [Candidatus Korobacteraceae bacterium]